MDLQGKVAIVTGGAIRVGRAVVLALADAGCDVFIHYGRSADEAQQTKADVEALGGQATTYSANLMDPDAVETVIPTAVERLGHVDILVNNAAVFPEEDSLLDTDPVLWDKIFAVNARAPFQLTQAFAHHIHQSGRPGKIINVNDARIPRPAPDHFAYRLAKRALWDMTEIAAVDLAPQITVNAVALGAILPPPGQSQTYLQKVADERVPLKRPGNAEIVAQNVIHLLQQDFLTGVTVEIDGGEFI